MRDRRGRRNTRGITNGTPLGYAGGILWDVCVCVCKMSLTDRSVRFGRNVTVNSVPPPPRTRRRYGLSCRSAASRVFGLVLCTENNAYKYQLGTGWSIRGQAGKNARVVGQTPGLCSAISELWKFNSAGRLRRKTVGRGRRAGRALDSERTRWKVTTVYTRLASHGVTTSFRPYRTVRWHVKWILPAVLSPAPPYKYRRRPPDVSVFPLSPANRHRFLRLRPTRRHVNSPAYTYARAHSRWLVEEYDKQHSRRRAQDRRRTLKKITSQPTSPVVPRSHKWPPQCRISSFCRPAGPSTTTVRVETTFRH